MIDVFFCVDASRQIGTGHLVRCLILADKLRDNGASVSFVLKRSSEYAQRRVVDRQYAFYCLENDAFNDPEQLSRLVRRESRHATRWLCIDSDEREFYAVDFQDFIRRQGIKLGMIVFTTTGVFHVDLLHNQNPLALDADYRTLPATKQLLGLDYVILKEAYAALQPTIDPGKGKSIDQVLVNFGGADLHDKTGRITHLLLENFPDWKLLVVIGGMYGHADRLRSRLNEVPEDRYRLYVNTAQMPSLMAQAALAITGGGLTAWELGVLYTPNFVIPSSERELRTAQRLSALSLVYFFGADEQLTDEQIVDALRSIAASPSDRLQKAGRMAQAINVKGAEQVARAFFEY